ncbi:hypothetical protein FC756_27225 [Lysinibacillus mangiferihumi]|uniref:DUF3806 domain-containing protein n=1 Tax=Lysinibacillus mangiferihumi TaxID=1130819 RepID=A0A4U2XT58_9BACI|nr:hypothetical protein [Lysinibacillus mangiferihumi]TKI50949.1 hypothetical protein FC756_27225 [Lysinibacillus mangiferihumi]
MQENWVVYQDNLKVRELKTEEMDEIKQLSVLSKEKLALTDSVDNLKSLDTIKLTLSDYRDNEIKDDEVVEIAFEIGSLYGTIIEKEYGWKWMHVEKNDNKGYCVVSEDNKFCCPVHNYIYTILTDTDKSNNVKLLFNMLEVIHKEKVIELYNFIS